MATKASSNDQLSRNKRLSQIVQVFTKYGLADSVTKSMPGSIKKWFVDPDGELLSQYSQAERLRMALSELGTTFIKLGQMMSTRDDLLDPALKFCFSRLLLILP